MMLAAVGNILRALFGFTRGPIGTRADRQQTQSRQKYAGTAEKQTDSRRQPQNASSKGKIFDDNEGEYVDYEEIKN